MPETNPSNNQNNSGQQPGMPQQQQPGQPATQPQQMGQQPQGFQQQRVQPQGQFAGNQPAANQNGGTPAGGQMQTPAQNQQRPVQQMQNMQQPQPMQQNNQQGMYQQQMPQQQMYQQARPGQMGVPVQGQMQQGMRPGQPMQQGMRPGQPAQAVRKPPSARRLLYWSVGCFGCSILLFVIFVLIFVGQTSPTGSNALAQSLGVDTGTFINTIIMLVNVIFGFFSIVLFIMVIVGIFRAAMARKEDRDARKGGLTLAGASALMLLFMIAIWVGIYVFLSSKQVVTQTVKQQVGIVTDPPVTLGLTAPVTIKFDGTKLPIDTKKYEILSFLWDFGDGNTSTVQSPSDTYTSQGKNNGRFDVKATVDLKDITAGTETTQTYTDIVTISNVKINADFAATPDTGPAPLAVSFDASNSSAPAGQIQSYEWDFDNNNLFSGGTGVKIDHTFDKVGTYTVNLRVTDNTGNFAVVSKQITVQGPNLPTATISIPSADGHYYAGTQYTFGGDQSSSPNGKITNYQWDFGDQTPNASTRSATHTYKAAGDYIVALTVTDDKGGTNQGTQKITVENPVGAPIAAFTTVPPEAKKGDGFTSGTVPFTVSFDGSPSSETNGNIVDYKWDFDGDGKIDAQNQQASFVYNQAGTFNATLTVVDASNKTATTSMVIKVAAQGLQANLTATPADGVVPLTVTFDASGSSYPTGQIVSYEWDFGDGTPKRVDASKVTYQYTQIGTFTAKVTAIASDDSRNTVTMPINVRPVPLKGCFTPSTSQGAAPLTVEFDPQCSTGTIAKYSWDFGDGQTSRTRKPSHTFTTAGSYQVKLQVADSENVLDTFTANILVTGAVSP
jgi:PKD repeat protein